METHPFVSGLHRDRAPQGQNRLSLLLDPESDPRPIDPVDTVDILI